MKTGMAYPTTIPAGEETAAYVSVLSSVPSCGLRKALSRFRNGQYENINLAFIPLPAELAAMSRAEAKTERDDLMRLRETKQTLDDRRAEQTTVSEEGRARVRKMLEVFRSEHRARKEAERGPVVEDVPTPEQIERWKKIMSMPDAPRELTAEEHAHRRTIAAKIEKAETQEQADAA